MLRSLRHWTKLRLSRGRTCQLGRSDNLNSVVNVSGWSGSRGDERPRELTKREIKIWRSGHRSYHDRRSSLKMVSHKGCQRYYYLEKPVPKKLEWNRNSSWSQIHRVGRGGLRWNSCAAAASRTTLIPISLWIWISPVDYLLLIELCLFMANYFRDADAHSKPTIDVLSSSSTRKSIEKNKVDFQYDSWYNAPYYQATVQISSKQRRSSSRNYSIHDVFAS